MRWTPLLLSSLSCAGCASLTPEQHAAEVRDLPGQQALRVGLVVLGQERRLQEAFATPPPAPGGAAPLPATGTRYAERTLLPDSLPEDSVLDSVRDLGAFTDVVPLPFDSRGIVSREALVQRLQDRLWTTAQAQELDALLVVEGVDDRGLVWSPDAEGLWSLDTVLWWLAWPAGLWLGDREYRPDVALVAHMYWLGDQRPTPEPTETTTAAKPLSLSPWQRASTPLLGLLLPPAWVADDPTTVAAEVSTFARAMLPIELVRTLKSTPLGEAGNVHVRAKVHGEHLEVQCEAGQEITEASATSLPRGALTESATTVPIPLESRLETSSDGPRHHATGRLPLAEIVQSGRALLRVRLTLASGDVISRTWAWTQLETDPLAVGAEVVLRSSAPVIRPPVTR
jgi:hypothetical protein